MYWEISWYGSSGIDPSLTRSPRRFSAATDGYRWWTSGGRATDSTQTNTSIGTSRAGPAARIRSAMPSRRKFSIVRALHRSIFGSRPISGRRRRVRRRRPAAASSIASVSPTGPPPTMSTGGSLTPASLSPRSRVTLPAKMARCSASLSPISLQVLDGRADVAWAPLGVVGLSPSEQHVLDAVELDRAAQRVGGTEHRGVDVHHLEVLDRPFGQRVTLDVFLLSPSGVRAPS